MPRPDGWDARAVPGGAAVTEGTAADTESTAPGTAAGTAADTERGAEAPLTLDGGAGGEIPFRPLSISEMLDGAIACVRLYPRAVLVPSVAVTAVIQVTVSVAAYFFVGRTARNEITPDWMVRSVGTQFTLGVFGLVLSALGIVLLAGLLGPVVGRGLFGLPVSLRGAWRDLRPRLGRLAAVGALVTFVPLLGLALPVLPFVVFIAADVHPAASLLAGLAGFPAGAALMVWLYVLLVPAAPALVMERESVGGALRRARRLSAGRWWRTFGTLLLAIMITVFMGLFALRIPFLLAELIFFGDGGGQSKEALLALALDTAGRIVSWSVVLPFDAGVIVLLYMDRRMRREGFDLELRTRVHEGPVTGDGGGADAFFAHWRPDPADPAVPPHGSGTMP
ncbi:hypothetical protein GCM10023085_30340 [Actinomadura viridis]|uniref:Glycerophosphoryl diester phosphodiesterase membrane domain-containing protein n=1 Tax=Actinomadura viridis TaxID=58110 RepID=A0A931GGU9_9ACTN|nr:hypothetical protein [Actinomadura viridis]MBG6086718.1 hypothetical protein [Actinomadura viridis]